MSPCVTVYINEISRSTWRGTLISLIEPCIAAGMFVVYALGDKFSWQTVALILSFYSIVVFFLLFHVPESYVWYVATGNRREAVESLRWFGRDTADVENEIDVLQTKMRTVVWKNNYFYPIRNRKLRGRMLMFVLSSVLQSMLGVVAINTHIIKFYDNLKTPFDGNVLSVISATISFAGALIAIFIIHKFKRKTVICISGLGMVIFIGISAVNFSARTNSTITLIGIFTYMFFSRIGIFLVPSIVIAESFPTKARATLISVRNVVMFVGFFISAKFYPVFDQTVGVEGVLFYLAILPFINVVYVIVFFAETKDRTIADMEEDETHSLLRTN